MRSSLASICGSLRIALSIVIIHAVLVGPAVAGDTVTITANTFDRINLVDHMDLLEDRDRALSISEVAGSTFDERFVPATRRNTNIGYTSSAHWLRFSIEFSNDVDKSVRLVLDAPLLDRFDLFVPNTDGGFDIIAAGDTLPFNDRTIDDRRFSFELNHESGGVRTFYARVISDASPVALPLYIYSQKEFASAATRTNFIFGIYFGMILLLVATSVTSYMLFKTSACLWYAGYLAAYFLLQMSLNGFGYQFLWPHSPLLQSKLAALFCGAAFIFGIVFTKRFLEPTTRSPFTDHVLPVVACIVGGAAIYHVFGSHNYGSRIIIACSVLASVLIFAAAARALYFGYRPARYFLFGWALLLIGAFITGLYYLGIGPNLPLSAYAMQIGTAFQIIFVSFALADQISEVKAENMARIQGAQLELNELNESLEQQVRDRTEELETRNKELTELAVRDGLTGLYNHSTAIELLKQVVQHGKRYDFPTAVMMLDIDKFKSVNDTFGHPAGDKVILAVSKMLIDEVRSADVVGRYGGDEFLIVLSHADVSSAREYGERLLERIRRIKVHEIGGHLITASLGISILNASAEDATAGKLIQRADQAMYKSKQEGRDRLTISNLSLIVANDG